MCKGIEEAAFELDAPVGKGIFWAPETSDTVVGEGANGGLPFAIRKRDGFWSAGETVDARKIGSLTGSMWI